MSFGKFDIRHPDPLQDEVARVLTTTGFIEKKDVMRLIPGLGRGRTAAILYSMEMQGLVEIKVIRTAANYRNCTNGKVLGYRLRTPEEVGGK